MKHCECMIIAMPMLTEKGDFVCSWCNKPKRRYEVKKKRKYAKKPKEIDISK